MTPEFDIVGSKVLAVCEKCGVPGEAVGMIVDTRFFIRMCDCGKVGIIPKRVLKRMGYEFTDIGVQGVQQGKNRR